MALGGDAETSSSLDGSRRKTRPPTQRITRRAFAAIVVWTFAAGLAATVLALNIGGPLEEALSVPGSPSERATTAIDRHVAEYRSAVLIALAVKSPRHLSSRSDLQARSERTEAQIGAALSGLPLRGKLVEIADETLNERTPRKREIVSLLSFRLPLDPGPAQRELPAIRRGLDTLSAPSVSMALLGAPVVNAKYTAMAHRDLVRAERVALPITFVCLLVAFTTLVAALLPLVLALATLLITSATLQLAASTIALSPAVSTTVSVLSLGLSIDYALFFITRFREERDKGASPRDALDRASNTAGRAIALSGLSVATASLSLLLVGIGDFSSMAAGGVLAGLIAVAIATTLLPALIYVLGGRLERLGIRRPTPTRAGGSVWHRWAAVVARHPVLVTAATIAVLAPLATSSLSVRPDTRPLGGIARGESPSYAEKRLTEAFGEGAWSPVDIATTLEPASVIEAVQGIRGIATTRTVDGRSGWSLVQVVLKHPPQSKRAHLIVHRIRQRMRSLDGTAYVGGITASRIDFAHRLDERTPFVILAAILAGFMGLAWGLRSLLVPLKAVLGTLLSVGAALGILTRLFSTGANPALEPLVPLLLFTIAFALSIDYEVFLLSRIKEEVARGASHHDAVIRAAARTSRSITLAGLCMAIVFAALTISSLETFKQLGLGVAIAVIIDVSLVRGALIPAATILFGRWNWWWPMARPDPKIANHKPFLSDD